MIEPKYDCKFIATYYNAILNDLDFLKILETVVNSEFRNEPLKLDDYMYLFYSTMKDDVAIQNYFTKAHKVKSSINNLCQHCRYKYQYNTYRTCRNFIKPII